jgi:hypothetical protein
VTPLWPAHLLGKSDDFYQSLSIYRQQDEVQEEFRQLDQLRDVEVRVQDTEDQEEDVAGQCQHPQRHHIFHEVTGEIENSSQ